MTILSDEQIESEIDQLDTAVSGSHPVWPARSAIRHAFAIGRDQGKAEMLESAKRLIVTSIADARALQLAASMVTIGAWISAGPVADRSISQRTGTMYADMAEDPTTIHMVTLWSGTDDIHFEGSDQNEALAKAATWIGEQSKRADTQPAPAGDVVTDPFPDTPDDVRGDFMRDQQIDAQLLHGRN